MAQLNPNFEIDLSDINSYEQIQLVNDAQLARENLLMQREYREPSDEELIRNNFSSYTFVDFKPRIFTATNVSGVGSGGLSKSRLHQCQASSNNVSSGQLDVPLTSDQQQQLLQSKNQGTHQQVTYEMEKFSEIFERINIWLKLNKDWRVVSAETLCYDSATQFNQVRSSAFSSYLPQNTRGVRLHLTPSKCPLIEPQVIGCINVVPRKLTNQDNGVNDCDKGKCQYENLDQMLKRLNELLTTTPIEGRILNIETIRLPLIDGEHVNCETNYISDGRMNQLEQRSYCSSDYQDPCLVDVLRVYRDFGPTECGLVNIIDFIPRLYAPTQICEPTTNSTNNISKSENTDTEESTLSESNFNQLHIRDLEKCSFDIASEKIDETDSLMPTKSLVEVELDELAAEASRPIGCELLTRLIRRSLAWFEEECKRLQEDCENIEPNIGEDDATKFKLRLCSVQVHRKTLLKGELIKMAPGDVLDIIGTRRVAHESRADLVEKYSQINNSYCCDNGIPLSTELSQPFDLKFVRLAYVVIQSNTNSNSSLMTKDQERRSSRASGNVINNSTCPTNNEFDLLDNNSTNIKANGDDLAQEKQQIAPKAMEYIQDTLRRLANDELSHQAGQLALAEKLNESPVGQLTYRLFAPCQLVNTSSCFAINPVNSSSPLSRRGSVDINGPGAQNLDMPLNTNLQHHSSCIGPTQSNAIPILQPSSTSNSVSSTGSSPFSSSLPKELGNSLKSSLSAFISSVTSGAGTSSSSSSSLAATAATNTLLAAAGLEPALAERPSSSTSRFTTNELESVEVIKKRMEVYVTTNPMKVVSGETIIVNLNNDLSCLSSAIEQTLVKSSFARSQPTTWVSVYVLYTAVDECLSQQVQLEMQSHCEDLQQQHHHQQQQQQQEQDQLNQQQQQQDNQQPHQHQQQQQQQQSHQLPFYDDQQMQIENQNQQQLLLSQPIAARLRNPVVSCLPAPTNQDQ